MHGHRGAVHVQLPHDGGAALQPCLPGLGAARAPPQPQQAHLQRIELSDTGVGIGRVFARACLTKQADWPVSGAEGTPDLWRIVAGLHGSQDLASQPRSSAPWPDDAHPPAQPEAAGLWQQQMQCCSGWPCEHWGAPARACCTQAHRKFEG